MHEFSLDDSQQLPARSQTAQRAAAVFSCHHIQCISVITTLMVCDVHLESLSRLYSIVNIDRDALHIDGHSKVH